MLSGFFLEQTDQEEKLAKTKNTKQIIQLRKDVRGHQSASPIWSSPLHFSADFSISQFSHIYENMSHRRTSNLAKPKKCSKMAKCWPPKPGGYPPIFGKNGGGPPPENPGFWGGHPPPFLGILGPKSPKKGQKRPKKAKKGPKMTIF